MTIFLFLLDTSASMNQMTNGGFSIFDISKSAIETFIKLRSRDPACRMDRYMLLTFDKASHAKKVGDVFHIKAGWRENISTLLNELKMLTARGYTDLGSALKNAFDLLNLNRAQSGIDTYGQGRNPFYLEPSMILCFTDGSHMTSPNGIQTDLQLPGHSIVPGNELTKEPFRWDQQLYGIVMQYPTYTKGYTNADLIQAVNTPIDCMCKVTGGQSYLIQNEKMLEVCLETLIQKVHFSGVMLNFQLTGEEPPPILDDQGNFVIHSPESQSWQACRAQAIVLKSASTRGYSNFHWPIPENFWPDTTSASIPPRDAQPTVLFSCQPMPIPALPEGLPFDKYELETFPLMYFFLERKQTNICWFLFMKNSAKYQDVGAPFGYIRASPEQNCLHLILLPYDFPVLEQLLNEFNHDFTSIPSKEWQMKFDSYLRSVPPYYITPLKRALMKMGLPNYIPEHFESYSSNSGVVNYTKRLKNQAKIELDRIANGIAQRIMSSPHHSLLNNNLSSLTQDNRLPAPLALPGPSLKASIDLDKFLGHPLLKCDEGSDHEIRSFLSRYPHLNLDRDTSTKRDVGLAHAYKLPTHKDLLSISRHDLAETTERLTKSLSLHGNRTSIQQAKSLLRSNVLHNQPVSKMSNYQDYIDKLPKPLRQLDEAPVRLHMFGNPFKVNKASASFLVDEAEDAMMVSPSSGDKHHHKRAGSRKQLLLSSPVDSFVARKRARKPGPLPRDFVWTPPSSRATSVASASDLAERSPPGSPESPAITTDIMSPPPRKVARRQTSASLSSPQHDKHVFPQDPQSLALLQKKHRDLTTAAKKEIRSFSRKAVAFHATPLFKLLENSLRAHPIIQLLVLKVALADALTLQRSVLLRHLCEYASNQCKISQPIGPSLTAKINDLCFPAIVFQS